MMIGGFKVGEHAAKEQGGKRMLLFDCQNCVYSANIADDKSCRYHTLSIHGQVEADVTILSEVYERVYDEKQTAMLKEIVALKQKFELESLWSYSHISDGSSKKNDPDVATRHRIVVTVAKDFIAYDPIRAYLTCIQEIKREKKRFDSGTSEYQKSAKPFLKTLLYIKDNYEKTNLVKQTKRFLTELQEIPDTRELYRHFFEAQIKPSFIGSRLVFGDDEEKLELLAEYSVKNSNVQIFNHPHKTMNMYFINPPEYSLSPDKYFVLSKAKEVVAGYTPGKASLSTVAKSRDYFERVYRSTIIEIAEANQIRLNQQEIKDLSEIVARYSVGYGILEILLSDRRLTDIYLDSPIGQNAIHAVHSEFGPCETNILYTENEAQSFITKMRAMSGRPFDEAHPVLDFDLPELDTRVAVIGPPMATDGVAFAFRLHKMTPWTLSQFIDNKFLNPLAAGMMSFFIDNQSTMLINGSRGAGKTSLMSAAILEILKSTRIIIQEDTLEIPSTYMKKIGFNIQRLKTRSPIGAGKTDSEVAPEEALRTALRLGDSALILGEVRSTEARTLYEAMRVGAAGNVVMGTIHGDSAYSVWDRVVNDLDVPSTSFKATDIVVTARPIRFQGSLTRHRRLVEITEIKKNWTKDPQDEGGLLDLMQYEAKKDNLELKEDNLKESDLFAKIGRVSGLSMEEMWRDIRMRAEAKQHMVTLKNKFNIPLLLEAEYTSQANDKLLLLKEKNIQEFGSVNYSEVLKDFKKWSEKTLAKKLVSGG